MTFMSDNSITIEIHPERLERRSLEYLPTISLADGRCVGAEALVLAGGSPASCCLLQFILLTDNIFLPGRGLPIGSSTRSPPK